jgi:hypothetical protein
MERKYRFQGSGRQENRVDQNGGGRRVGGLEGWRVGGLEGIKHVVLQFVVGSGEHAEA